jgi:hypothetical protein
MSHELSRSLADGLASRTSTFGVISLNTSRLAKSQLLPHFAQLEPSPRRRSAVVVCARWHSIVFGGFHSACEAGLRHAANCKIVDREQAPSLNAIARKTR